MLYIPGHITRACDYLVIVNKPTAWEVPSVTRQLSTDTYISFSGFKTVNWTYIV